mgnify:CR=1 FL=1
MELDTLANNILMIISITLSPHLFGNKLQIVNKTLEVFNLLDIDRNLLFYIFFHISQQSFKSLLSRPYRLCRLLHRLNILLYIWIRFL